MNTGKTNTTEGKVILSDGIEIYDDVFTLGERISFYEYLRNGFFQIGWSDSEAIETPTRLHDNRYYMYANWGSDNVEGSEILKKIRNKALIDKMRGKTLSKCVVNCSKFGEVYTPHCHVNKPEVILYYANLDWKREWYGETLFYSEDLKDIVHANPYVSGRIVWFRGEIPHCIRPSSFEAPQFRFTVSFFFGTHTERISDKKENLELKGLSLK